MKEIGQDHRHSLRRHRRGGKTAVQYESDGEGKELMMNELQKRPEIDSKRLKIE